ncbi:hypothetical protein U9M48_002833 [Paspalum notatum var. saurae]|uniref:Transposase-associated domain-containing protein n=1 Tax=Paspalum notatum var. saurae TaxID=547442 RepID=A0AAQ3PPZ4_PASNO
MVLGAAAPEDRQRKRNQEVGLDFFIPTKQASSCSHPEVENTQEQAMAIVDCLQNLCQEERWNFPPAPDNETAEAMARVWMYNWPKMEHRYRDEVDKFIEAAKKDAITKHVPDICCPCKNCKNIKVWTDPSDIRSHLIVDGFVKGYSVWIHHGEQEGPSDADVDDNNNTFFDADLDMLNSDGNDDHDNVGGTYCSVHSESIEDLGLYGDSDADDLEEMLKHFKADILYANPKGVANLKAVKDAAKKNV